MQPGLALCQLGLRRNQESTSRTDKQMNTFWQCLKIPTGQPQSRGLELILRLVTSRNPLTLNLYSTFQTLVPQSPPESIADWCSYEELAIETRWHWQPGICMLSPFEWHWRAAYVFVALFIALWPFRGLTWRGGHYFCTSTSTSRNNLDH